MREFILNNWPYIILGLMALLFLIQLRFSHSLGILAKHFSNQKVNVKAAYNHDMTTNSPSIMLTVNNQNVNDLKLIGIGFIYKEQTIDYFKTAIKERGTEKTGQLIIDSRDAIKIPVDVASLKNIIHDLNEGSKGVKNLEVFATDVSGTQSKRKAKSIRRMIKKLLKQDRLERKRALKAKKKEVKKTKKEEKQLKKQQRRKRFKNKVSSIKMKLKDKTSKSSNK
jgi:hypothetical protein